MKKTITFLLISLFFLTSAMAQQSSNNRNNTGSDSFGNVFSRNMKGYFTDEKSEAATMSIKDIKVSKIDSEEYAVVKLTVDGESTGGSYYYQLLLDPDCEMYEHVSLSNFNEVFYNSCEYSIPANAGPNQDNALNNGTESINIPGGTYDLFVVSPDPIMIFACEWEFNREPAMYAGFTFKAGNEYHFYVGKNDRVSLVCEIDAELTELIIPEASKNLTATEDIKMKIKNVGSKEINSISLSYKINDGNTITESYTGKIEPGMDATYTFNQKADMSAGGIYIVEAWISEDEDLNSMNNYSKKITKHELPLTLPFEENFENQTNLMLWNIVDTNNDGITWYYNNSEYNLGSDGNPGYMKISTPFQMDFTGVSDDYLILDPVAFNNVGEYHILFYTKAEYVGKESFEVLYGKESDPSKMTQLANYTESSGSEWVINVVNFQVDEPGNYYIAIHYTSTQNQDSNESGFSISLDQLTVGSGKFVGIPDLAIKETYVPASACGISSEERLGVSILNKGSEPVNEFKLICSINDGISTIDQTFYQTIGINETVVVYLSHKTDLSIPKTYELTFTVTTENEVNTNDNESQAVVVHYEPVTDLPFESIFSDQSDREDWNPSVSGTWGYNDYLGAYSASQMGAPLISRCIALEKGTYKFSHVYMAGDNRYNIPSDFRILYGKAGTDIEDMFVLKSYEEINTEDQFVSDEISFLAKEDDYIFAFIFDGKDKWAGLYVKSVTISKEDVAIDHVDSSGLVVYPNPVYDEVSFKSDVLIESIKIYDTLGKQVYSNKEINQLEYMLNVKDQRLNQGIYFVTIQTENGISSSTIIIK